MSVLGCDRPKSTAALGAEAPDGSTNPSQKPSEKPPVYDLNIFKVGQSWVWKTRTSDPKKTGCERWQIIDNTNSGVTIELRGTLTCGQFENTKWKRYEVNPKTGVITGVLYSNNTYDPNPHLTILDRFNGNEKSSTLLRKNIRINGENRTAFQIQGTIPWYIDAPETPLHAVLLQDDKWDLIYNSEVKK